MIWHVETTRRYSRRDDSVGNEKHLVTVLSCSQGLTASSEAILGDWMHAHCMWMCVCVSACVYEFSDTDGTKWVRSVRLCNTLKSTHAFSLYRSGEFRILHAATWTLRVMYWWHQSELIYFGLSISRMTSYPKDNPNKLSYLYNLTLCPYSTLLGLTLMSNHFISPQIIGWMLMARSASR